MPTRSHPQPPAVTAAQARTRPGPSGAQRGVPWWGVVPSAAAPVLLVSGWTIAGGLQPGSFDPVTSTVSALESGLAETFFGAPGISRKDTEAIAKNMLALHCPG